MSPTHLSRLESAMRLVLDFNEAFNRQDVAGMLALVSQDCIFENSAPAPDGERVRGRADLTQYWNDFFRNSAHAHLHIEEIFGLGMRCVVRWSLEWQDVAGIKSHVRGADIFQVREGLICERFSYVKG